MTARDLSDYVEVKDRIVALYEKYPTASLQSDVTFHTVGGKTYVLAKGYAYRDDTDDHPGIGHSWLEVPGATNFTRGSEVENAETSAWGRAIAALGFEVKKSIASANEIRSKDDTGDTVQQPATAPQSHAAPRASETDTQTPPAPSVGLTQPQRGKLQSFYRKQGWGAPEAHRFQFAVTGKDSTKAMDNADFDKLLAAMENPTYLALINADTQEAAAA